MFDSSWIADLDAASACAAVTGIQADLRELEWRELALAAHWAGLHGRHDGEPGDRPDGQPYGGGVVAGTERWTRMGGEGTPEVAEFAAAELAVVMQTGFISASSLVRDALDLQHRHPALWTALGAGRGRVWKGRQVARMVHAAGLTREQAWFVDASTTPYIDTLAWSAFTRLVEARIVEADPAAAEARREAEAMRRFVATGQSTEHGLKTLVARAGAGEVIYFVAVCDRIAQILLLEGDTDPVDVRRSKALAVLANPARALALLSRHATGAPHPDDPGEPVDPGRADDPGAPADLGCCTSCGGPRLDPERLRPRAVLYVRVAEEALRSGHGVVSCESGGGLTTVGGLADLLGHHHVTVRPVLDLQGQVPVDAYEVPHELREALRLARPSSVFPWSRAGAAVDLDHTRPYVPGGPPGQTRVGNLGPMTRLGHRVKTHGRGWRHRQPSPGTYLWRTPHGYWVQVDADETHPLGRGPELPGSGPPGDRFPAPHAVADLVPRGLNPG